MTETKITKHEHGDGTHGETRETTYPGGTKVATEWDTTDRNLLGGDKFVKKTVTDPDGNSKTTLRSK